MRENLNSINCQSVIKNKTYCEIPHFIFIEKDSLRTSKIKDYGSFELSNMETEKGTTTMGALPVTENTPQEHKSNLRPSKLTRMKCWLQSKVCSMLCRIYGHH